MNLTFLAYLTLPLLLSMGAQWYVMSTYAKWSKVRNSNGYTGVDVAKRLIRDEQLPANLEDAPGELSDHFDPSSGTVRLSQGVAMQPSVAAMAIAAHEFGHVQQYKERSPLIGLRQTLLPAVRFSPMISYAMIMAGIVLNILQLSYVGVALFALTALFTLLTLPIEFDASRRALVMLESNGMLTDQQDAAGAREMLRAAALTYVAAFVTALLQLMYYVNLVRRR
jgi:uncharacterized protein